MVIFHRKDGYFLEHQAVRELNFERTNGANFEKVCCFSDDASQCKILNFIFYIEIIFYIFQIGLKSTQGVSIQRISKAITKVWKIWYTNGIDCFASYDTRNRF